MSFSPQWKRRLLIIVLAAVLLAGYTWTFHGVFASHQPGAVDFFVRYEGARLYFNEGLNPYSEEVTEQVHVEIFGSKHHTVEPQHAFFYPIYTVLLIAPYTLLPTYAWVQAAWQVTLQVLLVIGVILTLRYFAWRPAPWLLALLLLWSLLLYPSARAIILGQLSVVVFFLTVLVFSLLFRGQQTPLRDIVAGICLALSTVKPQMQLLIIPLLVLWGLRARRWYFLSSAALSMAALLGVSFLMLPTWLADWLTQMSGYFTYMPVQPPVLEFITHQLQLGDGVLWILRSLLVAWLLIEWWLLLQDDKFHRLGWTLALTLVVTHLIAPQTGTYQYVVFLFVLLPILQQLEAVHPLAAVLVMLILFVGDWWLFSATVVADAESHLMSVPLPLVTLALLLAFPKAFSAPLITSGEEHQHEEPLFIQAQ